MSWFKLLGGSQPPPNKTYVVMGKGGVPKTVTIDEDENSGASSGKTNAQFDFQYKIPISRYSTLAHLVHKPNSITQPDSQKQSEKVTSSEAKKKTGPRRVKVIDIGRGVTDRKLVSPDRVVIAPRLVRKDSEPP